MPPEIQKAAEQYVKSQVEMLKRRVPKKDVQSAIRKVAEALDEIRVASEHCSGKGIDLR
jgi:chaperonin cofactor prefoldin